MLKRMEGNNTFSLQLIFKSIAKLSCGVPYVAAFAATVVEVSAIFIIFA